MGDPGGAGVKIHSRSWIGAGMFWSGYLSCIIMIVVSLLALSDQGPGDVIE